MTTRSRASIPIERLTQQVCDEWRANPTVNPLTGRRIDPNATYGIYHMLEEACDENFPVRQGQTRGPTQPSPSRQETVRGTVRATPSKQNKQKAQKMTRERCEQWARNPKINPMTGKEIDPNIPNGIYAAIEDVCHTRYGIEPGVSTTAGPSRSIPKKIGSVRVPTNRMEWAEFIEDIENNKEELKEYSFIYPEEKRKYEDIKRVLHFHPNKQSEEVQNAFKILNEMLSKSVEQKLSKSQVSFQNVLNIRERINTYMRDMISRGIPPPYEDVENIRKFVEHAHREDHTNVMYELTDISMNMVLALKELAIDPEDSRGSLPSSKSLDLSAISSLSEETSRSRKYKSSYKSHEALSYESPLATDLAPLPVKKRQQILQELKDACTEMRDAISFQNFDRMKKKQLQLIVKLGDTNKKRCYYVRNIYDQWKHANMENKPFVDPLTRKAVSQQDKDRIMDIIRYIAPNAKDLRVKKEIKTLPELIFNDQMIEIDERLFHFYEIMIKKRFGTSVWTIFRLGYIPADLEPGDFEGQRSQDHSSAVLVYKLKQLHEQGRLLVSNRMPYKCCRVHLNKSIEYWLDNRRPKGISTTKVVSMLQEIDSLL